MIVRMGGISKLRKPVGPRSDVTDCIELISIPLSGRRADESSVLSVAPHRFRRQTAAMKAYVGVTDGDWYDFLAARPDLDEVNFWRPGGGRGFHVLMIGEPFCFKTHYRHNRIMGGGFFSGFAQLKLAEAWEFIGEANGTPDSIEMRNRIGHYPDPSSSFGGSARPVPTRG